ncbi:hypothetical protein [Chromobacterium sphagni]|uniref:Uncharacterized protein n=1 Tax=Chromobacterium sphagni TaxID=1903179 RepID=A0A1S1WTK8_9NEIS|nr:hypothetical protein [Chromobacterium sphagni]OHX10212.1 hypothetical protein BI347_20610 [Chromobacterium sphagni]OHX18911.1 hypothetical protein BI344_19750 [Chromobacterium sphagni]
MSSNTIHITASDNELYVIAYQWGASYQLAHIQSGNGNAVNVTVNINSGAYTEPAVLNGVNGALNSTYAVNLPNGDYEIVAMGVNWGGPWSFALNVNGGAQKAGSGASGNGVVWFTEGAGSQGAGIPITVQPAGPQISTVNVSSHPTIPAGLQAAFMTGPNSPTPDGESATCNVISYNGLTYWAYSYIDNRVSLNLVAYDASGKVVAQQELPGARYLWKITSDATKQTVTFYGQSNQTVSKNWNQLPT